MGSRDLLSALAGHERIAVDAAPIIYYLEGEARASLVEPLFQQGAGRHLVASVVTEAEALVGALRARGEEAATIVRSFFDDHLTLADVTRVIADRAARFRAEVGMHLPDAVVAATAVALRCTVLVGNDRAFKRLGDRPPAYVHLDDLVP